MVAARLVDDVGWRRTGAEQMALDEALLDAVTDGAPAWVRVYTWGGPTLSLGRFQPDAEVDDVACDRHGVDVVRRPSGGRALLHGGDLTYAIAMRRPAEPVRTTYCHVAGGLIDGLARLGVTSEVARRDGPSGPACFGGAAGADLRVGERKVCGSAMVRHGDVVLQHGSVLLRRLPIDESDVLVGTERAELREVTVTLEELGAPTSPALVAAALVAGLATALDLDLHETSRASLPEPRAGRSLRV